MKIYNGFFINNVMEFYCYILHSVTLNKFYIGSTSELPIIRLTQHNTGFYGKNKFTHSVNDWQLYFTVKCNTRKQEEAIEKHIKAMKSAKYIMNLKKYPEIINKLLEKYRDS